MIDISNEWLEIQRFTNNDNNNNAIGRSLSTGLTSDGIKLLVSGTTGYGTISTNKPSVYVYNTVDFDNVENDDNSIYGNNVKLTGGQIWTQLATLRCPNADLLDQFGTSVDIWDKTIVVGASYSDNGVGASYVYDAFSSSLSWTQTTKLLAKDGDISDFFGVSVGVKEDYIFIGASGQGKSSTGAVYVFKAYDQGNNTK